MRRMFAFIGMSALLLSAGGCAIAGTPGTIDNRMTGSFSADVTLSTADGETKGTLTRYGNEAWSMVFSEPKALAGVQLDFLDDEVTASYKGLEFSVPQSAQAVRTMLEELMDLVDEKAEDTAWEGKQEEDRVVFECELDDTACTLSFQEDGTPIEYTLPSYGLTLYFDSFTEGTSAPATEAATAGTEESTEAVTSESTSESQ